MNVSRETLFTKRNVFFTIDKQLTKGN